MNSNIPDGLRHILEVCRLVRLSHRTRISAINEVASIRRIDPQTVRSACTRSIGIKVAQLDNFLLKKNFSYFRDHLVKRFPSYQQDVETFFKQLEGDTSISATDPASFIRTLFPDEKKDLVRLLLLHEVRKQLLIWSERADLPADVKNKMVEMGKQIDKT